VIPSYARVLSCYNYYKGKYLAYKRKLSACIMSDYRRRKVGKMNNVFTDLQELTARGEDGVLAVIFARAGSAPRTAGARMLVYQDGSISGTIGGGLLEARVQQIAVDVFRTRACRVEEFSLTGADASQMEMICGGEVAVLVEFIDGADARQNIFYQALSQAATDRRRSWLITDLPDGEQFTNVAHALINPTSPGAERNFGVATSIHLIDNLPEEDLNAFIQLPEVSTSRYPVLFQSDQTRLLVEPLGAPGTLFLFGGGHVSQKLAPLADLLGFRTVVVDDRSEFANTERFPLVNEFVVPDRYEVAFQQCEIDAESYLVIVTRGHLHDKTVLEQALRTPAAYIGMIGSIRKRNAVYDELRADGFTDVDFSRVHSPIGLKIGAESPEEIAVSIAAELIQVRSGLS
jgi:xanthine dehydrogenase accessory factor